MPLTISEVMDLLTSLSALGDDLEGAGARLRVDAQKLREQVKQARADEAWTPAERRRVARAAFRLGADAAPAASKLTPILAALARDVMD